MRRMKQIAGQITIFEYLASLGATEIEMTCLAKQETVFYVSRERIMAYEVFGFYSIYDEESVVLVAKQPNIPLFRCVRKKEIGKTLFKDPCDAEKKALSNIEADCIPVSQMHVKSFKAYVAKSPRGKPSAFLTAFYAVLDNGYVYMKDYYSCGHLLSVTETEAKEMLEEQIRNYGLESRETTKLPSLKTMYKVRVKDNFWKYAESDCPLTQAAD